MGRRKILVKLALDPLQVSAGSSHKNSSQVRIAVHARAAVARHLPAREDGGSVHVVLHILRSDHHVAHLHALAYAAGHAGKDHAPRAEALGQTGRRGGGRHLADAAQGQHHIVAGQAPTPEGAAGVLDALGGLEGLDKVALLFGQGAQDGDGHGVGK